MNRPLKFRAWDKKSKKIRQVKSIAFDNYGISSLGDNNVNVVNMWGINCIEQKQIIVHRDIKDVELMQDTGLKDKNGIEIYEGDIVKTYCGEKGKIVYGPFWDSEILDFDEDYYTDIDKEERTSYGFHVEHKNGSGCNLDNRTDKWITIVGNVYENKDLLEAD